MDAVSRESTLLIASFQSAVDSFLFVVIPLHQVLILALVKKKWDYLRSTWFVNLSLQQVTHKKREKLNQLI